MPQLRLHVPCHRLSSLQYTAKRLNQIVYKSRTKMQLSANIALALLITLIAADGQGASGHPQRSYLRDNADIGAS